MSKAVRMLNKYEYKELLLNGKPQWANFYKEELIGFLEVAQELLKDHKSTKVANQEAIDYINNLRGGDKEEFMGYGGNDILEILRGKE